MKIPNNRLFLISVHTAVIGALVLAAITIVAPLTYDDQAHQGLDAATRYWSGWGDQLMGLDLTIPRQNIFSLARDLDRSITIIDHTQVHISHLLGLVTFVLRGRFYTVADALRWFAIPLTAKQALAVNLCMPLDRIHEDEPIVIQPDPYQYGIASWYGPGFDGRLAASGEIYHMNEQTAAHKTLPLQSVVRVVAVRTGISTIVRINDRGPYVAGRIIDLSYRSKTLLGMDGVAMTYIERLDPTALDIHCQ